jgi:UDP-GlcNAc:undecaprenyl-phosphate/decaprenyl-phosphate GlcNAc-1-phosphate transferase
MVKALIIFTSINILILIFYNYLAKIVNVYDIPNKRKIHKVKTPIIGGIILLINFISLLILFEFGVIDNLTINAIFKNKLNYFLFSSSLLLIFLIGFIDDKIDIKPNLKLFCLALLISFIQFFDNSILITEIRFSFTENLVYLGKYSFLFTALCFLLFINACNMFDGINLQSCLYYLILSLYLISLDSQNLFLVIMIISIFIICILNSKGKIFLGDGGVFLCSFVLAYFTIKYYNINVIKYSDKIFILMMVPGIDMFRLFIFRLLKRKNPFEADNSHIHHILLEKFTYPKTIMIIFLLINIPIILSIFDVSSFLIILIYLISYFFLTKNHLKKG